MNDNFPGPDGLQFQPLLAACIAWFSFAGATVSMLTSLLTSQYAIQRQIDLLDAEYLSDPANLLGVSNIWSTVTEILNWLAILFFVTGVGFFATFSFMNLPAK